MAAFGFASIVLVDFPFSDLSDTKLRPAIVLTQVNRDDFILCQITSNAGIDAESIEIKDADFINGSLRQTSYARPGKIFTGHKNLINRRVGILKDEKASEIVEAIVKILRQK